LKWAPRRVAPSPPARVHAASYGFWWWYGYGSIPMNTIFRGMNIHKSQLFWCELHGYKVLTLPYVYIYMVCMYYLYYIYMIIWLYMIVYDSMYIYTYVCICLFLFKCMYVF
jgi:hypothetical protein